MGEWAGAIVGVADPARADMSGLGVSLLARGSERQSQPMTDRITSKRM